MMLSRAPQDCDIGSARILLRHCVACHWHMFAAAIGKPSTCQAVGSSMALQVNALGVVAWRIPEISNGKEPFDGFPILIVTMKFRGFQANCHNYHFIRISISFTPCFDRH